MAFCEELLGTVIHDMPVSPTMPSVGTHVGMLKVIQICVSGKFMTYNWRIVSV